MLQNEGRIKLTVNIQNLRKQLLRQGIMEVPVDGEVGIHSTYLKKFHPDPADRFIVTTSLLKDATLITADGKILSWMGELKSFDASN
jgi:PIN domain nuclease of toxin-antitoxin system